MSNKIVKSLMACALVFNLNSSTEATKTPEEFSFQSIKEELNQAIAQEQTALSVEEEALEVVAEQAAVSSVTQALEPTAEAVVATTLFEVNREEIPFGAYNINGYTYVKVSDLANSLTGTASRFHVGWDSTLGGFSLVVGDNYYVPGYLYDYIDEENKVAALSDLSMYSKGKALNLVSYIIDGQSYFSLQEMSDILGYTLSWSEEDNLISIHTTVFG